MKKKVLYILGSDYTYGGVEVAINTALPDFIEKMDFKLICTGGINLDFTKKISDKILNENIIGLNLNSVYKLFFGSLKAIKSNIKGLNSEIVVLSLWKAVVLYLRLYNLLKDKKVILFIHSTKFIHILDYFFNKTGIKFSTIIFADSQSSANWIETMSNNQIIQISLLRENAGIEEKERTDYKEIRLISVSRISPEKGYGYMLLFIKKIIEEKHDFTWDIYGAITDEKEKKKIELFIVQNKLEREIIFHGAIQPSEVFDVMGKHDFFMQFSLYEGMAMSVSEAMSCGLVCLIHPVGEIPYYSKDMHSALFISELNHNGINELYEKFLKVLNDNTLYKKISYNAIQQFKSKKIFAESFCDAIHSI